MRILDRLTNKQRALYWFMHGITWLNAVIILKWDGLVFGWSAPLWAKDCLVLPLFTVGFFELCFAVGALLDEHWEKNPPDFE